MSQKKSALCKGLYSPIVCRTGKLTRGPPSPILYPDVIRGGVEVYSTLVASLIAALAKIRRVSNKGTGISSFFKTSGISVHPAIIP